MKRIIICIACTLSAIGLQAQNNGTTSPWTIGLRGGWTSTTISRYDAGRMDETYSVLGGLEAGIQGSYRFNSWFALRANFSFMQRSHRMDRNLNYLDPVYTEYRNSYLMLPMVADFSFGSKNLLGHLLAGGYTGYWRRDARLHRRGQPPQCRSGIRRGHLLPHRQQMGAGARRSLLLRPHLAPHRLRQPCRPTLPQHPGNQP